MDRPVIFKWKSRFGDAVGHKPNEAEYAAREFDTSRSAANFALTAAKQAPYFMRLRNELFTNVPININMKQKRVSVRL